MLRKGGMKPEAIAHQLAQLGMGEDEAAVYVQLWRVGPSKAAELAQSLRHSRPRTYRALAVLAQDGFVSLGAGRPRLYTAVPPGALFEALQARAEALTASVRKSQGELVPELGRMGAGAAKTNAIQFTTVRGLDALINQAHGIYAKAERGIDMLFTHQGGRELLRAVDNQSLLAKRARDGVRVRLLLRSAPDTATAWAVSDEFPNVDVRLVDTDVISTAVVVDGRETLVVVAANPAARYEPELAVAFRTDAAEFVAMQGLLFDRLWSSATQLEGEKGRERVRAAAKARQGP